MTWYISKMKTKCVVCRDGSVDELVTVDITAPEAIAAMLAAHKTGSTFYT